MEGFFESSSQCVSKKKPSNLVEVQLEGLAIRSYYFSLTDYFKFVNNFFSECKQEKIDCTTNTKINKTQSYQGF